jgi:Na+/melibiose symporter-like transporter
MNNFYRVNYAARMVGSVAAVGLVAIATYFFFAPPTASGQNLPFLMMLALWSVLVVSIIVIVRTSDDRERSRRFSKRTASSQEFIERMLNKSQTIKADEPELVHE